MANKRRTRQQKQRAAAQRKAGRPAHTHPEHNTVATDKMSAPDTAQKTDETDYTAATEQEAIAVGSTGTDRQRHRQRMRMIRVSLFVFAVLVAVQLGLWGLVQLDVMTLEIPA